MTRFYRHEDGTYSTRKQKTATQRMQERAWVRHVVALDELERRRMRRRRAAQKAKGGI